MTRPGSTTNSNPSLPVCRRGQPSGSQLICEPLPWPDVSLLWRYSPAAFLSPIVLACCCLPQSVIGGAFVKASPTPPKPHTPERSCGLNAWPSTLYFTLESALSLL